MTQPPAPGADAPVGRARFNRYLLRGIVALTAVFVALGTMLYLLPTESFQTPELQPDLRISRQADFPVGASRVVTWGSRILLIVHSTPQEFAALEGTSPLDGCILNWDPVSMRVVSPCSFLVYDLHGNVVRGLTTVPLRRYPVFVRQGDLFVTGS